mmetsp:Transcript_32326/g.64401  ORF Transcript_32326/g.64401 Transcript_32326/m.64401 type:complete len:82 (+) Transcript_32326:32-277(+)
MIYQRQYCHLWNRIQSNHETAPTVQSILPRANSRIPPKETADSQYSPQSLHFRARGKVAIKPDRVVFPQNIIHRNKARGTT